MPTNSNGNDPRQVAQRVAREISLALGLRLLGVYLHGSVVSGDFAPGRSDLDLLAVLVDDPDGEVLARLDDVHDRVEAEHESWRGRIEVEYVGLGALNDAANGVRAAAPTTLRAGPRRWWRLFTRRVLESSPSRPCRARTGCLPHARMLVWASLLREWLSHD